MAVNWSRRVNGKLLSLLPCFFAGHVLPPVTSRKDLIHLLSQTLNSRTLTAEPPKSERKKKKSTNILHHDDKAAASATDSDSSLLFSSEYESSSDAQYGAATPTVSTPKKAVPLSATATPERHARRRSFQLSTVDLLTRRLLISASRTGTGGDAYFLV
jgi:hypothetical protein